MPIRSLGWIVLASETSSGIAVDRGRSSRPQLKTGICGEHGGDPRSIDFAEEVELDYLSCSPPRLPVARLAAAQAALRQEKLRQEQPPGGG